MANLKSQIKRNRQNEVKRLRNRSVRSEMRGRIKNAKSAIELGDGTEETAAAIKNIDKAASKGIIHANKAARQKSRLQKQLNTKTN